MLGTIGEPLPFGVSFTKGPNESPAFHFRSYANVGRFASYIFPKQFFAEFSITLTIKPKRVRRGLVFSILPHFRTDKVLLALEIRNVKGASVVRLTHASSEKSKTVFDFEVPDISNKWTWLGFSVKKDGVVFYLNCDKAVTKFRQSFLGELSLPPYSVLYIGRAGWSRDSRSSAFEVRHSLCFVCLSCLLACVLGLF